VAASSCPSSAIKPIWPACGYNSVSQFSSKEQYALDCWVAWQVQRRLPVVCAIDIHLQDAFALSSSFQSTLGTQTRLVRRGT
jgi:hypothetical protein